MTKIVVLDGYTENPGDLSWSGLEAMGELTVYDRTAPEQVAARIGGADIVFTNKTPVTRADLEACPNVKMVSVLATGYNIVDCVACKERGIPVTNIPTYGTAAVGQFAIALLLEICHHVAHHSEAVRQGRWESCPDWCFWDYPLIELAGKTLGIIGFGRIGQATGKAAKALGMRVIAFDSHPTDAGRAIADAYVELDGLFAEADVVALHCPLFPETEGIINKAIIMSAHLFVFYFGIIADITPPVALAAMAGSAIAKGEPFKTGVTATRIAIGAFIVPYIFVLNPVMLMIDSTVWEILQSAFTALLGMYALSGGLTGYVQDNCTWYERLLLVGGGLGMIIPGTITDIVGLVLVGGIIAMQKARVKKRALKA